MCAGVTSINNVLIKPKTYIERWEKSEVGGWV